jgi:hypothetical protein
VIIGLVLLFYGLVPAAGAVWNRYHWAKFRRRFDELRLRPLLGYDTYSQIDAESEKLSADGQCENFSLDFRFIGDFESITDGHTLWVQGENLTLPVSLAGAEAWLLPMQWKDTREGSSAPFDHGEDEPERVRWNRIATFTEGARVFVGGHVSFQDGRWGFVSTKETPLMVIFYECGDRSLVSRTIRSSRQRNEYWNVATPYSLALGAISLLYVAWTFLNRPAFHLTVIVAMIALFVPLMPWIPPGLLCTMLYRRLSWLARKFRAYSDLARLPLRYLGGGKKSAKLPNGEQYGYEKTAPLPREEHIPLLIPDPQAERRTSPWYVFGVLGKGRLPSQSVDPFAVFCALPDKSEKLTRRYAIQAYALEAAAWLVLLAGIGLNIFFVITLLRLL